MREKEHMKKGLRGVALCFGVSSCSVLVSAVGGEDTSMLQNIIGILFWAGLLGGCILYGSLCRIYKESLRRFGKGRFGPLHFFAGRKGILVDGLWLAGLAVTAGSIVWIDMNGIVAALGLFLLVGTTYLHFIINGKLFGCCQRIREERSYEGEK